MFPYRACIPCSSIQSIQDVDDFIGFPCDMDCWCCCCCVGTFVVIVQASQCRSFDVCTPNKTYTHAHTAVRLSDDDSYHGVVLQVLACDRQSQVLVIRKQGDPMRSLLIRFVRSTFVMSERRKKNWIIDYMLHNPHVVVAYAACKCCYTCASAVCVCVGIFKIICSTLRRLQRQTSSVPEWNFIHE